MPSGKFVFRSADGLNHRPLLDHNHPFGIFRVAQFARAESIGHEYEHGLIPTVILRDHSYTTYALLGGRGLENDKFCKFLVLKICLRIHRGGGQGVRKA